MYVLLSNDDGIMAPGLRALYGALRKGGDEVCAIGPMRQQSGVSHSLTVFEPLRAQPVRDGDFEGIGIHGTPADCVRLGLGRLVKRAPDLVLAGINQGPNAGPDVLYSGTIAAAAEAANAGLPSVAISHGNHLGCEEIDEVAEHAINLVRKFDWMRLPGGRVLNINYPDRPPAEWAGVRVCHQSSAVWANTYNERQDPRGNPYWWLEGEINPETFGEDSDRYLLARGFITITPLKFVYTDDELAVKLRSMGVEYLCGH